MNLTDLVGKSIEEMTDDELLEKLRVSRHNRHNQRPKVTKKATTTSAKAKHKRVSAVQAMLTGLSDSEKEALIAQLEQGEANAADGTTG